MVEENIMQIVVIYLNTTVVEITSLGTKVIFRFTIIIVFHNQVKSENRNENNRQKNIFLREMNNAFPYCNVFNFFI